jgi:hypothetical protein
MADFSKLPKFYQPQGKQTVGGREVPNTPEEWEAQKMRNQMTLAGSMRYLEDHGLDTTGSPEERCARANAHMQKEALLTSPKMQPGNLLCRYVQGELRKQFPGLHIRVTRHDGEYRLRLGDVNKNGLETKVGEAMSRKYPGGLLAMCQNFIKELCEPIDKPEQVAPARP